MTPEATGAEVRALRLQAIDRRRQRPRANRADADAELRLLPGPAAAEAGARRRRRHRLQRRAERHADARGERRGARSARRHLSSPDHDRPRRARSGGEAREPAHPRARSVVDVTTAEGLTFTLAIDSTRSCRRASCRCPTTLNLGDVAIETSFADYQDVSGLKLPARADDQDRQGHDGRHSGVTKQTVDGDAGDLAAPAGGGVSRADHRTAARQRHRAGSRERHLVPRRPVASQRARRVHRSPDADRGAAERRAHAGGDREGPGAAAEQAAHARRRHAPSLRSLRRHPRGGVAKGSTVIDAQGQRRLLPGCDRPRAHASRRTRCRRTRSR